MQSLFSNRLPLIYVGVGALLTLVLLLLEPSSAQGITGFASVLFWALHVAIILPILYAAQEGLGRLSLFDRLPPITLTVIAAILGAAVFTPFAIGLDALFSAPNDSEDTGSIWSRLAGEYASFVSPIALVWVLLNARALSQLSVARLSEEEPDQSEPDVEMTEDEREFWSRMPVSLGKDIVAVSAELHYLRVHTPKGDTLILFGFGRSLEVLQRFAGLQIHRSHWVAIDHVAELEREGANLTCRLDNGLVLPVSRKNAKPLKERVESRRIDDVAGGS